MDNCGEVKAAHMTDDERAALHNCLLTVVTQLTPAGTASSEEWERHRDAKELLEKFAACDSAGLNPTRSESRVLHWVLDRCLQEFDDADLSTMLGITRAELRNIDEMLIAQSDGLPAL